MAKAVVFINGRPAELPDGDTLAGVAGGGAVTLDVKQSGTSVVSTVSSLIIIGGAIVTNVGGGEVEIAVDSGGSTPFRSVVPNISALKEAQVTGSNTENFTIGAGTSDQFKINIDKCGSVTVTLTSGTRTAQQICDDINTALYANVNYNPAYEYAIVSSGAVVLRSIRRCIYPEIVIETVTNNAYTVLGFSTGTTSGAEQELIRIHPHRMLLPDLTVQKITTVTELDITDTDDMQYEEVTATNGQTLVSFSEMLLEVGKYNIYKNDVLQTLTTHYTLTSSTSVTFTSGLTDGDVIKAEVAINTNTWYFLYITDDSRWSTRKAFISNQQPTGLGEHTESTVNGAFIGSFYAKTSSTIRAFIKIGKTIYTEENVIYNATRSAAWTDLDVSSVLPPTSRDIRIISYSPNSTQTTGIASQINSGNVGHPYAYSRATTTKLATSYASTSRNVSCASFLTTTVITVSVLGYLEDCLSPLVLS